MKKYKSIKTVYAEQMGRIEAEKKGLVRDIKGIEEDGYIVKYSDEYTSWSPKKAFEDGYILES